MKPTEDVEILNGPALKVKPAGRRIVAPTAFYVRQQAIAAEDEFTVDGNPPTKRKMGWIPDLPDCHDYTFARNKINESKKSLGFKYTPKEIAAKTKMSTAKSLPAKVDLSEWFSPIEDQGSLGSCTANAGAGVVEYFERRAFGKHIDASRLFLYKVTRNIMKMTGDTGAYLRSTMQALAMFGIPPEEYWPYRISSFEKEPTPFCYSFAQNYRALQYVRLDPDGKTPNEILDEVKRSIAAGIPAMFGFTCFTSIDYADDRGAIPFPATTESVEGGHAVVAMGYDNSIEIVNPLDTTVKTKGAFKIRNSWGMSWGDEGYGWLPYEYILKEQAVDWWAIMKADWIDTGNFEI